MYRFDDAASSERLATGIMDSLFNEADGYAVFTISMNANTGYLEVMRGDNVNGFVRQITASDNFKLKGGLVNILNLSIGGTHSGNDLMEAEVSHFWMIDEALDILDPTVITSLVAQDGLPADLGSDGSNPSGTAAVYLFEGAASGFLTNKGSGADLVVSSGALTDVSTGAVLDAVPRLFAATEFIDLNLGATAIPKTTTVGFTVVIRFNWAATSNGLLWLMANAFDAYFAPRKNGSSRLRQEDQSNTELHQDFATIVAASWAAGDDHSFIYSANRGNVKVWADGATLIDANYADSDLDAPHLINSISDSGSSGVGV